MNIQEITEAAKEHLLKGHAVSPTFLVQMRDEAGLHMVVLAGDGGSTRITKSQVRRAGREAALEGRWKAANIAEICFISCATSVTGERQENGFVATGEYEEALIAIKMSVSSSSTILTHSTIDRDGNGRVIAIRQHKDVNEKSSQSNLPAMFLAGVASVRGSDRLASALFRRKGR